MSSGPVLVTGASGMLGSQLLLTQPSGLEAHGTDLVAGAPGNPEVAHPGVDLTDEAAVEALFEAVGDPVGVIHGAAYTAVDKAEEDQELAHRVNAVAPEVVAAACARRGIPMVFVSTDFVFDGTASEPYATDHGASPLGVYGRTKFEGEQRAQAAHPDGLAIVRTQWLYGPRGGHFPGTILRLASERDQLKVVSDQVGSPTSTLELAPALWDVLSLGGRGVYHGACEGSGSWYDFAAATLQLCGKSTRIDPCSTDEFPRPAPRPAYSVLDASRLAELRGRTFLPWREALTEFLRAEGLLETS